MTQERISIISIEDWVNDDPNCEDYSLFEYRIMSALKIKMLKTFMNRALKPYKASMNDHGEIFQSDKAEMKLDEDVLDEIWLDFDSFANFDEICEAFAEGENLLQYMNDYLVQHGAKLKSDLTIELEKGAEPVDWEAFDAHLHNWKARKRKFQKVLVEALDLQHGNAIKTVKSLEQK